MKIPLLTGAYQARSVIASAQRCVNLFPEKNNEGETFPTTHYPTPGLRRLLQAEVEPWRCLFVSSDNRLFGVCGVKVYQIREDWTLNHLGDIETRLTPCSMEDNGVQILLVDGSVNGYTITLGDLKFARVSNDAFYGSTRIAEVDGYLVLNRPGTNQWYITLFSDVDFDSLDFASKIGHADKIVCIGVTRRNIFIFGDETTEVWTNTGGADFTFSRIPGAFIQFGCAAPYSLTEADGSLYWVSKAPQGDCMVLRTSNYDRERISTFAIENELQGYERVDDAIGYVQQMAGHYWYVLTFPTANKTWVYDLSTNQWHERAYLAETGVFERHRANCFAFWNGRHVVGDYKNGRLYEMDLDTYNDDGNEIRRIRSFPHMVEDGNRIAYRMFQADMEAGHPSSMEPETPPEIRLRFSDTKGNSWSQHISTTLGFRGQYGSIARWHRLGQARDRVFEISWSADCRTALNGAFIDAQSGKR
jgi:hypothetical protein